MWRYLALGGSTAAMAFAAPVSAETVNIVSGWRLERGEEPFRGCAISRALPTGVMIGFVRQPNKDAPVKVLLMSRSWSSLVDGQTYTLNAQIGSKKTTVAAVAADRTTGKLLTFDISWDQYYRGFFSLINGFFFEYNGVPLVGYSPSSYEREAVIQQSRCIQGYGDPFAR